MSNAGTECVPAPSTTVGPSDVQLLRNIAYSIGMLHNADYGTKLSHERMLGDKHAWDLHQLIQRVEKDLLAAAQAEYESWEHFSGGV